MRNSLGQEITVGAPVVLITQGQGWVGMGAGRVSSIKKVPVITYLNGDKSSGVQRWERLLVISEAEYAHHERRYEMFVEIEEYFWTHVATEQRSQFWKSAYGNGRWSRATSADFRQFINGELNRRGEEPWYD